MQPTIQAEGVSINDDQGLEKEADVMGAKALQMKEEVEKPKENTTSAAKKKSRAVANSVGQKKSNVKQGYGFVDNRLVITVQPKLKEMTNNTNLRSKQKNTIQNISNSGKLEDKALI